MSQPWNPELYQASHGFVWQYGRSLLELLAPQPGERILDAGCGTGQLTAEVARSGADVVGVDRSENMVQQARHNFPEIRFEVGDLCALNFHREFDAVFSNAVLHWVRPAQEAADSMARSLKPGGRLVAELGAQGNTRELMAAVDAAWEAVAHSPVPAHPWYYPSLAEYCSVLERAGLEVSFAAVFPRPTSLDPGNDGLWKWLQMFGGHWTAALHPDQMPNFRREVERRAAPALLRDGVWTADYRRLRVVAVRSSLEDTGTSRTHFA